MDVNREVQACDFGGCYVIYVNILKMEVIYVIFFFRGYVWKCLLRNRDDKCKEYCKLRIGNRISSIYGIPSISPAGWSPSGLRLTSSAALPLIRPRDSRWKRCLVASPSSWPVCLAKAEASILICLTATLCTPPRA